VELYSHAHTAMARATDYSYGSPQCLKKADRKADPFTLVVCGSDI